MAAGRLLKSPAMTEQCKEWGKKTRKMPLERVELPIVGLEGRCIIHYATGATRAVIIMQREWTVYVYIHPCCLPPDPAQPAVPKEFPVDRRGPR
jgi:hypothetical protein